MIKLSLEQLSAALHSTLLGSTASLFKRTFAQICLSVTKKTYLRSDLSEGDILVRTLGLCARLGLGRYTLKLGNAPPLLELAV